MDLVQTVRKEGSRGGTGNFSWDDVKGNARRETYLGHSLMAPVGRWQQGKDLNWYSKGDEESGQSAADARKEELLKVKQAEEEHMAKMLGTKPPSYTPNTEEVGSPRTSAAKNTESRHERRHRSSKRDDHDRKERRRRSRDRHGERDDHSHRRSHRPHRRSRSRSPDRRDRRRRDSVSPLRRRASDHHSRLRSLDRHRSARHRDSISPLPHDSVQRRRRSRSRSRSPGRGSRRHYSR